MGLSRHSWPQRRSCPAPVPAACGCQPGRTRSVRGTLRGCARLTLGAVGGSPWGLCEAPRGLCEALGAVRGTAAAAVPGPGGCQPARWARADGPGALGAVPCLPARAGQLCSGNLMLMTVGSCSSPSRLRQIKALGLVPEESDRCSLPLLCFPAFILLANACHIFTARGNGRRDPPWNRRWEPQARLPVRVRHSSTPAPACPRLVSSRKALWFGCAEVFLAESSGVSRSRSEPRDARFYQFLWIRTWIGAWRVPCDPAGTGTCFGKGRGGFSFGSPAAA